MKKYIVTEKHGFLKSGIVKFLDNGNITYTESESDNFTFIIDFTEKGHKEYWLKDGWIEEIQEKEFTLNNMRDAYDNGHYYKYMEFDEWIEEYLNTN